MTNHCLLSSSPRLARAIDRNERSLPPRRATPPSAPPRVRVVRRFAAFTLGLALATGPAGAAFYWVGNGGVPPCTHATLQDAIVTAQTNATGDVIYVVGNVTLPGDLVILPNGGGLDLQITGGVSACGSVDVTTVATISAPAGKRAFTIAVGADETVTLWNLIVTNDNGTYGADGGAIYFSGAAETSTLRLVHTVVRDSNCLGNGGGLYIYDGLVELMGSTVFAGNSAANGGAIALSSTTTAELSLAGVTIENNTAFYDGGGVYAIGGTVDFRGASTLYPVAVSGNVAGANGGGFYFGADASGGFGFSSVPTEPIDIVSNQAYSGGGIYVESTTPIALGNAIVELNQATLGGAVAVTVGGGVAPAMPHGPARGLPLLSNNEAADGMAVYASGVDTSITRLEGTITGHVPGTASSSLVTVEGSSTVILSGATVHHNNVPYIGELRDRGRLIFSQATVAANFLDFVIYDLTTAGLPFSTLPAGKQRARIPTRYQPPPPPVELHNSVFSQSQPFYDGAPALDPVFDCVVSRFSQLLTSVPAGVDTSSVLVADPLFVGAEEGDFHLRSSSPAVDLCADPGDWLPDGDGDLRGFDEPATPNAPSITFDAGADEVTDLFGDGFETGTTSRWSSATG